MRMERRNGGGWKGGTGYVGSCWGFPVAQLVKNLPAMQETPVRFLGQEDPLEKG